MKKDVFQAKAAEMGDFYVYFNDPETKAKRYAVATADLSTQYIRDRIKGRNKKVDTKTHAVLFSWSHNTLITIPYENVTKLVPLASVLNNGD